MSSWYDEVSNTPEFYREYALLAATEAVAEAMDKTNTDKKTLADKMGRRPSYITRFMNGPDWLEVGQLAELLYHMGYLVEINIRKSDEEPKK